MFHSKLSNVKRNYCFILATACTFFTLFAQNPDYPEQKADSLTNVGNLLITQKEYKQAVRVLRKSLNINHELKRQSSYARDANDLGTAYHSMDQMDSAIYYYKCAIENLRGTGESETLALALCNLSMIYKNKGQYETALEYAYEALEQFKGDLKNQSSALNTIASIYYRTGDYDQALHYYHRTLSIRKQMNYPKGVAISLNNIANVYNEIEMYDSALINFQQALLIKQSLHDKKGIAITENNLGLTYLNLNLLKEAEIHLLNALNIKKSLKEEESMAYTLKLLARLYLKKEQFENAKLYLDSTYQLAVKYQLLQILQQTLYDQSEYHRLTGDYRKQSENLSEYILINDSLLDAEKAKALTEMQIKYDTEKKDQEISHMQEIDHLQKTEIRFQRKLARMTSVAAGILLVLVLLIFYLLVINRRKTRYIENLNREMQHRIKNNLQILSDLLNLQTHHLQDAPAITALKMGKARVNAMALIHQLLYTDPEKRKINARKYILELGTYLRDAFLEHSQKIEINDQQVEELYIDVDPMVSIGLILNELITNAIKHAFADQCSPVISIQLKQRESKRIFLEVRDNGRGVDPDILETHSKSFGTKLIRTLRKQLSAESNIFNQQGAVFQFSIPIR